MSAYYITILITVAVYALLAHSLNIITGRAGQISLGHAAFFGIGAYTAGMLYSKAGIPFWIDVPLAALGAGLVGALLGIPCLRVRDDFLAITTMGINFVVEAVFLYIPFFGGAMGVGGINLPGWFGREMSENRVPLPHSGCARADLFARLPFKPFVDRACLGFDQGG